ncbi:MAG: hypothetical protein ACOCRZ_06645 [Halothermotrichaceae bacterium]
MNKKKYPLIVKLSQKMKEKEFILSKMALQEMLFLLEELYSVPVGYKFELLTYGPYSVELTSDLDQYAELEYIDIDYVKEKSYTGSKILPGLNYKMALAAGKDFLDENEERINKFIEKYGNKSVRDLEVRAVIVFLVKKEGETKDKLIERIKDIKPYFDSEDIIKGMNDLSQIIKKKQ